MTDEGKTVAGAEIMALRLAFDETTCKLTAHLEAASADTGVTPMPNERGSFDEIIEAEGFNQFYLDESVIEKLFRKFKKQESVSLVIGERRDAELLLTFSPDLMKCYVEMVPPMGGEPLTVERIEQILLDKGLTQKAIDQDAIKELSEEESAREFPVASGKLPKQGKNSYFEMLLDSDDLVTEEELQDSATEPENEAVDFLAGKDYHVVEVGTQVLKRHPPTQGISGFDVKGRPIPPKPGKEIPFSKDWKGTEPDPEDPDILVANVKGHPIDLKPGIRIDETLKFKGVNLNTGHIEFDGSVEILGDVAPGMRVKVTGDVHVKGVVERATVIAGNDVFIDGGILGEDLKEIPEDGEIDYVCHVEAGGDLFCRYINLSDVTANRDLNIREYAFHSMLHAGRAALFGQKGGKGVLVGGRTFAGKRVKAKHLGNDAYQRTRVTVGISADHLEQLETLKKFRSARIKEARYLVEILERMRDQGPVEVIGKLTLHKGRKIKNQLDQLRKIVADTNRKIDELTVVFGDDSESQISAQKYFSNLFLSVDGGMRHLQEEHASVTFVRHGKSLKVK